MTPATLFESHFGHKVSLLTACVLLFLVDSNKFLGRFFTVSITISNQFSVLLEGLTIFVSHQKHTPESCPRRRSLTPRRCNRPIPSKYSIRLFFKWFRREAVVTAFWTVSISPGIKMPPLSNPFGVLELDLQQDTYLLLQRPSSNQSE
jgi:hypothetical protein